MELVLCVRMGERSIVCGASGEKEEQLQLVDAQSDQLQLPGKYLVWVVPTEKQQNIQRSKIQADFTILSFAILC